MEWKLAEAKNRLSELIRRVISDGPQLIRRRNDAFIVLTERHYRQLTAQQPTLKDRLLHGPDLAGLDLERDQSPARDVEL